jgi:hypothetical protein
VRFIGDSRGSFGLREFPQALSESSFILALGLSTKPWKGLMLWGEAGSAISYLRGHMLPDYRGGASFLRGFGPGIGKAGWFFEIGADAVFVSRFQNDVLVYQRNRIGYAPPLESWKPQFYWNAGITRDLDHQQWATYTEQGPGVRMRWAALPSSFYFSADFLRVVHSKTRFDARPPIFHDTRAGVWYAISH